ncbi:hypothetical protein HYW83_05310 [Candidatus Peregrinibacteria bacterium]|nr:hypothetical protein [Candidatus Peregrinibacteria bacterium]
MDTPQIPNSPIPSSPPPPANQIPPTAGLSHATPPAIPAIPVAVKTAGFFTGKVIAAIIGVAVVGGSIGVGYFVFPEPFYNTVGKYIGLPAPTAAEERAAAEEETAGENGAEANTDSTKNLFDLLSGADANIAMHIKISSETRGIFEDFEKKLKADQSTKNNDTDIPPIIKELSGGPAPQGINLFGMDENNKQIVASVEEIAIVAKQDFSEKNENAVFHPEETPAAFAVRIKMDGVDAFETILKEAVAKKPDEGSFEKIGDDVFVIQMLKNPLQGKFNENPMYSNIASADGDLVFAFNAKEAISKWLEKNAPSETDLANPQTAKQFTLIKAVQSVVLTGSLKKDESQLASIMLQIRLDMDLEQNAADGLNFIQPQISGLFMFIPEDFQPFLKIDFAQEKSVININITINRLEELGQKINDSLNKKSTPAMNKPFIDESPADLPNLNQPDPSVLDGKVRRKKN